MDEAHAIRNHNTVMSKACCELRGSIHWGLTGTPIQNKQMDVFAALKFLRVRPFDDLHLFRKWINVNSQDGMSRLHSILKPLMLRRTKAELQLKGELQELPQKVIKVELVQMFANEATVYTQILSYSQTLFAQYMHQQESKNPYVLGSVPLPAKLSADVQKKLAEMQRKFGRGLEVNSAQILILLLRLRQICCHPGLIHSVSLFLLYLFKYYKYSQSIELNIISFQCRCLKMISRMRKKTNMIQTNWIWLNK